MIENTPGRVMVVDDHPMVRESLVFALNATQSLQVVGELRSGLEAIKLCPVMEPDIIVMDVEMPVMGGLEAARIIHAHYPDIQIVIFTNFECDKKLQQEASDAGAVLCLNKQMSLNDLTRLLEAMV